MGSIVSLRDQPCPLPKGHDPSVAQKFWDLHGHTHSMRINNQILHGDQTRCEESFYMVDHDADVRAVYSS